MTMQCEECGSDDNVRRTLLYGTGEDILLCWPCRKPIVMGRVHGEEWKKESRLFGDEEKSKEIDKESRSEEASVEESKKQKIQGNETTNSLLDV